MNKVIRQILAETGSDHVKNIVFDERKDCWIISYRDEQPEEECSTFFSVLLLLTNGSN